jgi:hypothetical protein
MVLLSAAALVCIAALGVCSTGQPQDRQLLREMYSPTFGPVPPQASLGEFITQLRNDLASPAGRALLARLLPTQAAVLWVAFLVMLAVAFDFGRPRRGHNVDLLVALVLSLALFDIMRFFRIQLTPTSWRLLDLVFTVVVAANVTLLVRALLRTRRPASDPAWRPNIRGRALAAIALVLLAANVLVALQRDPDDAGFFVNLGAQRLRERGRLPYGDPLLTNTPGAAYGPVLYAAQVPFQVLIDSSSPNSVSSPRPPMGDGATYVLPPALASKLCTIAFHLAGVLALFIAGRRLSKDPDVGWALVALYCGSAFVLGVGGDTEFIGGMTFISHIAPAAATLVAFACLPIPWLAGAMLAVSTGAGFYPAFMLPAWTGYFWRERTKMTRFLAGFVIAAALIGGSTWLLSRPADGRGRIGTILNDTFGHHTAPDGYGRSPYGFWGQRAGIREWMVTPLVGQSGLTTPTYFLLFGLVAASVGLARGASASRLALLTAAIAIAFSVVKIHATGTYVAWAYPFLLIGIFASSGRGQGESS